MQRAQFRIDGLHCAEEASALRRACENIPGVSRLSFDMLASRMDVDYDPSRTSPAAIARHAASTGLGCEPWREYSPAGWWARRGPFTLASVSGAALGAGYLADYLATPARAIYLISILAGAGFVLPKALRAAVRLRADMNVLMTVSVAGAMLIGDWSEGATVSFLFALSNLLEAWSVARARRAIAALMRQTPHEAAVVDETGERRVPVEDVAVGSRVLIRPGEKIPCDGEVVTGRSDVDEAPITGESVPVLKDAGCEVLAGTVNGSGSLEIRTTRMSRETTLARMAHTVQHAQHGRAPVERWVEQFARYYTPITMAVALLVAIGPPLIFGDPWSKWFYQGLVTLLIACPCALVISTPVTIVSALTSAARRGVLIKGGAALETAARLRAVALDKTGSLTKGEPEVRSIAPLDGHTEQETLERIAGVELRSEHPLARAVVRFARARRVRPSQVDNFQALAGRGAEGEIGGGSFWVGGYRLLRDRGVETDEIRRSARAIQDSAHTVVACGDSDRVWALVGATDAIREGAADAVRAIRHAGVREIVILTGDQAVTAKAVARHVGADSVLAELSADDKVKAVRELAVRHRTVAMVGEGMNDTPAMAAASLGIALGARATDAALEAADVVLLSDDLSQVAFLVRHAGRALGVIRENVGFALSLKALFLVLAFTGHGSLWMAIAADTGATLMVILNGLRLLRAR